MASESKTFQIDTKGLCILCLKDGCFISPIKSEHYNSSAFQVLLRYLKINTHKICSFSTSFLQSMDALEDTNVIVSLCAECNNTLKTFAKLHQDMELIRLQLDSCLQVLHTSIQHGGSSQVRLDEYRRRMRSRNLFEMFNANVANSLRNETKKKCEEKVNSLIPRVSLFQRDPNSLANLFGFPPLLGSQLRKMPGPKSKTTAFSGPSRLKSLLSQQKKVSHISSQNESILLSSLLGRSDEDDQNDGTIAIIKHTTSLANTTNMMLRDGVECSENFVVKLEPSTIIQDDSQDVLSNFHDENEDDNGDIEHDFTELENAAAISDFDGRLIGHFLGKTEDVKDSWISNEKKISKRSTTTSSSPAAKEGEDYFSCNLCNKSFSSAFSLGGHMHVHKNRLKSGQGQSKKSPVKISQVTVEGTTSTKKRITKRKIRCTICKKIFISKESLATHVRRYHSASAKSRDVKVKGTGPEIEMKLKCEICGKQFLQHTVHRTHMLSIHSRHVFSKYLPSGTTDEQLETAIQGVVAQHREILDPNKKKSHCYGCQFCQQVHPHPSHLRLHLLRTHFDKVVLMLQSLFSGNGETEEVIAEGVSTEPGDEEDSSAYQNDIVMMNGNDDDDGLSLISNELEGPLGIDEEMDLEDQQPPILTRAFTLAEGEAGGDGITQQVQNNFGEDGDPLSM